MNDKEYTLLGPNARRVAIAAGKAFYPAAPQGLLRDRPRRFFSVVDAVVAGQGNGPLDLVPVATGLVLAGANPLVVDLACARLMDCDYRRIPMLWKALAGHRLPLVNVGYQDIAALSDDSRFAGPLVDWQGRLYAFRPHFG